MLKLIAPILLLVQVDASQLNHGVRQDAKLRRRRLISFSAFNELLTEGGAETASDGSSPTLAPVTSSASKTEVRTTLSPTVSPTKIPTRYPTSSPTDKPTTDAPTTSSPADRPTTDDPATSPPTARSTTRRVSRLAPRGSSRSGDQLARRARLLGALTTRATCQRPV